MKQCARPHWSCPENMFHEATNQICVLNQVPMMITNWKIATRNTTAINPSTWPIMQIHTVCFLKEKKNPEIALQLFNKLCRIMQSFLFLALFAPAKQARLQKKPCTRVFGDVICQTTTNFYQQPRKFKNCQHFRSQQQCSFENPRERRCSDLPNGTCISTAC